MREQWIQIIGRSNGMIDRTKWKWHAMHKAQMKQSSKQGEGTEREANKQNSFKRYQLRLFQCK